MKSSRKTLERRQAEPAAGATILTPCPSTSSTGTGCEFAPSCLGCPYEMCIYEEPGGRKRFARRMRDMEMMRLFSEEKKGVGEIALRFAVSERTVQRALKRSGNGG